MNMALNAHLQNLDSSQAFQCSKRRVEEMHISLICRFIFFYKEWRRKQTAPCPPGIIAEQQRRVQPEHFRKRDLFGTVSSIGYEPSLTEALRDRIHPSHS